MCLFSNGRLTSINRLMGVLLLLSVALLANGCSRKGTVSGKVLYNGKPLTRGYVSFLPESGKGAFSVPIKEDGTYTIEGVPVGKVKITVVSPSVGTDPRMAMMKQAMKSKKLDLSEEAQKSMPPGMKDVVENSGKSEKSGQSMSIPTHYRDAEKSGLELVVTGGQQTHNIELK